jgi:hypothetical protein
MSLLDRLLSRFIGPKFKRDDPEMPICMVLLLRQPHTFSKEELTLAAEKAWERPFDNGDDSKFFVTQSGPIAFMKVGKFMLHFPVQRRPYLEDPEKIAQGFAREELRNAWRQHRAWVSIDCMNRSEDVEMEYCVIAKVTAELLDENCVGLFMPHERSFMTNDRGLREWLVSLGSRRKLESIGS